MRRAWFACACLALVQIAATERSTASEPGSWPDVSAHRQALDLLNRGVLFEAARLLQQHVAANPDDGPARFDLATVYFRLERDRDAVEELLRILDHQPDHVRARRLLVRIRMRLGRNLDWEDRDAVLEFARLCSRMQNYDRARACYILLLRDDPEPSIRLEFAHVLSWAGRHAEAATQFEVYLSGAPDDAAARHHYARALIAMDRIDEAEDHIRRAIDRAPHDMRMRMDHARTLIWLERKSEAEEALVRIAARDADLIEPRLLLADLLLSQDRIEQAYALYQEVLQIEPNEVRATRKVHELRETGRIDLARFRRRLKEDPGRVEERDRFIRLLIEQGHLGEALRELEAFARVTQDDESLRQQIRTLRERQRIAVRTLLEERAQWMDILLPPPDLLHAWLAQHPDDERARKRGSAVRRPTPERPDTPDLGGR